MLDNLKAEDNKQPNHLAAALYDLVAPPKDFTKPVGEWNSARIVVRGWHVEHWLNGRKTVDVDLASPEGKALIAGSKFKTMPKFATLLRGTHRAAGSLRRTVVSFLAMSRFSS